MSAHFNLIQRVAKQHRDSTRSISEDILYRWSPRSCTGEVVLESTITGCLEAARWAPSSFNNQPWRFYFAPRNVEAFTDLFKLLNKFNQDWCQHAGALLIIVSKTTFDHNNKPMRTHSFDTGAAWYAFALEACRQNLLVHAMGGFDIQAASEYLSLDDEHEVECMVALGQPSSDIFQEDVSQRRPLSEIALPL